ncbi:MAG: phosphonate C-P lyase system protein PhnG [Pseudonocardia sp.]
MTREERAALLAVAEPGELVALADELLARGGRLDVLRAPEVGCVATQVVEPVRGERFMLGDVLACEAEVALDGVRGWAMRLGDDRAAVLAAAVCDAAGAGGVSGVPGGVAGVAAGLPAGVAGAAGVAEAAAGAAEVDALCARVAARVAAAEAAEWAALAPTVVEFEELS